MLYPDMDGTEVLKAIRSESNLADTKIITTSATEVSDLLPRIEGYDVSASLMKPIKTGELKTLLSEICESGTDGHRDPPCFILIDRQGLHKKAVEMIVGHLHCKLLLAEGVEEACGMLRNVRAAGVLYYFDEEAGEITQALDTLNSSVPSPVPIIVLSKWIDNDIIRQLAKYGVSDILTQPILPNRLRSALQKHLTSESEKQSAKVRHKDYVLIVEDFSVTANLIKKLLSKTRLDVRRARNGAEALTMIQNDKPSLMLLDLNLPEINGLELLTILRENSHEIPFAVITAENREDRIRAVRLLNPLRIFPKPLNSARFQSFIRSFESELMQDSGGYGHDVLVSTSDKSLEYLLETALEEANLTFHVSKDAGEALHSIQGNPPITIIDISTDSEAQMELIRKIRTPEGSEATTIVSLVAELDDALRKELADLGVNEVLSKPVDFHKLIETIRELLSSDLPIIDPEEFAEEFLEELNKLPAPDHESFCESAGRIGHNLYGTAGLVSNRKLRSLGEQLNEAAQGKDLDNCRNLVDGVMTEIKSMIPEKAESGATSEAD
jgi:CheY-like chemotaxis protein